MAYDVPEAAIRNFEQIQNVRVTVHDIAGTIHMFLPPDRAMHTLPQCSAVKASGGQPSCMALEVYNLRPLASSVQDGRIHLCHAGLVEWALPAFVENRLEWIIFAGARRPGRSFVPDFVQKPTRWDRSPWPDTLSPLPMVEQDEAELVMEHFRQLRARLIAWRQHTDTQALLGNSLGTHGKADSVAERKTAIEFYIAQHARRAVTLADIADALSLSPSRASHAITESCGKPFQDLLTESRIKTAMGLLVHSSLSVAEVAEQCGFRDVSHFHRVFVRQVGNSPGRYRKQSMP